MLYKMENNYETLRMPELKGLARERRLRAYSQLRKAELIALLQDNEHQAHGPRTPEGPQRPPLPPPQMSTTWEPEREQEQPELEVPLMKRQLKHRRNRDSKLAKCFKSLNAEISNLKSEMEALENKTTRASESTNARTRRKKIRAMTSEANKIAGRLAESEVALRAVEPRVLKDPTSGVPLKLHPPNRNRCIEAKIANLNKKIRRSKGKTKSSLIAKRDNLKAELREAVDHASCSWGFIQLQKTFNNAYRSHRIAGYQGIDPDTFFAKMRKMLADLIHKETTREAVRTQASAWIKFRKGSETVDLAFNSRTLAAYGLNDIDELVVRMLAHM